MKKIYNIGIIPGDTVGPDFVESAVKVLKALEQKFKINLNLEEILAFSKSYEKNNQAITDSELEKAISMDAIIVGNIGDIKYSNLPLYSRPDSALLKLRNAFKVTTNIRPIKIHPLYKTFSPLKDDIIKNGLDIVVVRDLQGGMFAGLDRKIDENKSCASDLEFYDENIIKSSAYFAFQISNKRSKTLVSLDKSNILASSVLWRKTIEEYSKSFKDIKVTHDYIDTASMQIIKNPSNYDVILTSNVFGDIIADVITELSGIAPLLGSCEISESKKGIYTPNQLHSPFSNYVGKNILSPIGLLSSIGLMFSLSFDRDDICIFLNKSINNVLSKGFTTYELQNDKLDTLNTKEMTFEIIKEINSIKL